MENKLHLIVTITLITVAYFENNHRDVAPMQKLGPIKVQRNLEATKYMLMGFTSQVSLIWPQICYIPIPRDYLHLP
jgi:hypothetical protein